MVKYLCMIVLILLICPCSSAQDYFNKVLLLDGNKNYVEIPYNEVFDFNGVFTVEFRIKMNSDKPGMAIGKWKKDLQHNNMGWFASMNFAPLPKDSADSNKNDPFSGVRNIEAFGFSRANWNDSTGFGGRGRSTNFKSRTTKHWNLCAYGFCSSSDTLFKYSYTYNADRESPDGKSYPAYNFDPAGRPVYIGGFPSSIDSTLYIDGFIDEVRIWNITRTRAEVKKTWNDTLGPEYYLNPESGLVAYYRLDKLENLGVGDDGLADDVRDLTLYGNHGDIKGTAVVVDPRAVTGVKTELPSIPSEFSLHQNYPNPFNGGTVIKYTLLSATDVVLKIYNSTGQEIKTLHNGPAAQGLNTAEWDGTNSFGLQVSSGIYFYSLRFEGKVKYKKMLYMK